MRAIPIFLGMFLVIASGCGHYCQTAREDVLLPISRVSAYLQTNPNGEALASTGCPLILEKFKKLPAGAETVRRIADQYFTHAYRKCLIWGSHYRWFCDPPFSNHCFAEPYTTCEQWAYDTVHDPAYNQAIQFSQDIDSLYAKSHHMCGQAIAGNYAAAYTESRDLLSFVIGTVIAEGNQIYTLACTNRREL